MNLLRYAVMLAEERSSLALELDILAAAFEKRMSKHLPGKQNPFLVPANERFLGSG
jgi:hypothetical protein